MNVPVDKEVRRPVVNSVGAIGFKNCIQLVLVFKTCFGFVF